MWLRQRSYQKELLDKENIPFAHIQQNMQELGVINYYLGGHKITLKGIRQLVKNAATGQPLHIVEIGCGGGDNLYAIQKWAQKQQRNIRLTGIDINPECIAFARQQPHQTAIQFICSDYKNVCFDEVPHLIFSSLFCHHFSEEELIFMLQWMHQHSKSGFFINDLHRHPLAYYSIKMLTQLFSKSYLVKNDAPLSVQRGFKKAEWQQLLAQAGIKQYQCRWQWAFRWLVLCSKAGA